jgi:hypothetical protein
MSRKKVSHYGKIVKMCQFYSDSSRFFCNQLYTLVQSLGCERFSLRNVELQLELEFNTLEVVF